MFDGKSAFITGGGTGIGLACAKAIVDGGGRVTIAGRREETLQNAVATLGPSASWAQGDVTDEASVVAAVATAVKQHGPLHLAVNSAYGTALGSVLGTPGDVFAWSTDSTLNGTASGSTP